MTWRPIENSLTADSSDMNDNFNHIAAGTIDPWSSAGVSFVPTDSVYNIGTTTSKWDTAYINNIDISSNIESNGELWILEAESLLSVSANAVEFTGLNGDASKQYMIIGRTIFESSGAGSVREIKTFNGQTSGNYAYQLMLAYGATKQARNTHGAHAMYGIDMNRTVGASNFSRTTIYSKTGNERLYDFQYFITDPGNTITLLYIGGGIWSNTSDNITSIEIKIDNLTANLGANSHYQLWSRK